MSNTADRLVSLIKENLDLDHDPDLDVRFSDVAISSVEAVAFFKLVNDEFSLGLAAEECQQFETLRQLVDFIDARGG